jgi:hypothetical protein
MPTSATTVTASSSALSNNEVDIQADLNETVKQLGVTPSQMGAPVAPSPVVAAAPPIETPAPEVQSIQPSSNIDSDPTPPAPNQAGDLPPLPEI